MKSLKASNFLIAVAAVMLPQLVNAAEVNGAEVALKMANSIDSALKSISSSGKLLDIGLTFFGIFVVGGVAWQLVKGLATGRMLDALLGDVLPLGIAAVMAYAFMGQIPGVPSLVSAIEGLMSAIHTALLGAPADSIGKTITYAVVSMTDAIISVTDLDLASGSPASSWSERIANFATFSIGVIYKILMIIAVTLGLLFATVMFIGTLVMTQIAFAIALIFAPLFIPFITFSPAVGFFNKWLSFTITASITKILGLLVLSISTTMLKSMVEVAQTLPVPANAGAVGLLQIDMIKYTSLILLAGMIALLMMEVPKIALGLIGGVSAGFSGWGSLNKGVVAQGPLGGIGSSGGGSGKGAGGGLLTRLSPNMLKPVAGIADAGLAAARGGLRHGADMASGYSMASKDRKTVDKERENFMGPNKGGGKITRDTSKMSPATRNAYISSLEKTNQRNMEKGMDPYTVTPPVSSTDPKFKK